MLHIILFSLWFLLPAAAANSAPIFVMVLPHFKNWNHPLDGNLTFRGKRLFGAHKTWRGLISGMIAATLVLWLQKVAGVQWAWVQSITAGVSYASLPTLVLGPLFGLGALGGDALKSFFKRQRHIPSGHSWIPFDQLDYVIGSLLVSLPFVVLPLVDYGAMAVIWFIMHLGASYIGWRWGLKKRPI